MKKFIIVSKDAMCRDYLEIYGKRPYQNKTPNINELASKGTVFNKHYVAAPSTVMAFFSMITGKFAHETEYEMYERKRYKVYGETLFTKAKNYGYDECHIIWDPAWDVLTQYFDCYRDDVKIHSENTIRQKAGVHRDGNYTLTQSLEEEEETLQIVENKLVSILDENKSQFIWLHLPHVIKGRTCYGTDIDVYDKCVGMVRKYFSDDEIALTADHGNMNGRHGKLGYGYDTYDIATRIPLITPRIGDIKECNINTSTIDLATFLFEKKIPKREFVYVDTAYRAQRHRKLAIINGDYKYVFHKQTRKEELYDLRFDPDEHFSLISNNSYDVDRHIYVYACEEYAYPRWDELEPIREKFRNEKERIWRNGSMKWIIKSGLKDIVRPFYERYNRLKKR